MRRNVCPETRPASGPILRNHKSPNQCLYWVSCLGQKLYTMMGNSVVIGGGEEWKDIEGVNGDGSGGERVIYNNLIK